MTDQGAGLGGTGGNTKAAYVGGLEDLAGSIAARLSARGETIAVSKSSAGGLISAALLAIPGASAYFNGGGVVYTAAARQASLGIDQGSMARIRSATELYASMLARAVRARLATDWAVAETGSAGPAGNRYGDAAGHVCLAIAGPFDKVTTLETGKAERVGNMRAFARAALSMLNNTLEDV